MKKSATLLLGILLINAFSIFSQTNGTLDFSVKITEPTGGYNNKIVIAIWLEDSATGNFIKTKMRYAQAEVQYLNVWIAKSGQNVVDAVTGATTSPGTFSILWNGTAVNGTQVPDGVYNVWIQFSDKNQSGPTKFCTFTKGPQAVNAQTFPNSGNFTNMVLSWIPSATAIPEALSTTDPVHVFPNPASNGTTISFRLKNEAPVSVAICSAGGTILQYLASNAYADAGTTQIFWDGHFNGTKAPAGVYYVYVTSREFRKIKKVVVL